MPWIFFIKHTVKHQIWPSSYRGRLIGKPRQCSEIQLDSYYKLLNNLVNLMQNCIFWSIFERIYITIVYMLLFTLTYL